MTILPRCAACRRRIWPWQRRGWDITHVGTEWFHTTCYIERRLR